MPKIMIKGEEVEIDFYREDVANDKCADYAVAANSSGTEIKCGKPSHVSIDDAGDTICNSHRLEMTPGARRRYIKIEDVPFKVEPRSASEVAFNGDDFDDDDYEIDDDDLEGEDAPANAGSSS